ncbi:MAG: DinB family protein [Chitinophagaceae bacterium]|nr:DinB family protein [Chitinophagaceae bacterium]
MKPFKSLALLEVLEADVRQLILIAVHLQKEDPEILLKQPAPGKWNIAQVLEHLNSYGRYYLPAIEQSLQVAKPAKVTFSSGWLGNYFTNLMKPGVDGKIGNKMNAPKNHRPSPETDIKPALDNFLEQQQKLLQLLEWSKTKDIGSIRTPVSISRLIKLKVGDVLRFFIAHEQRHFLQIGHALTTLREPTNKFQASHLAVQP